MIQSKRTRAIVSLAVAALAFGVVSTACGSTEDADPTPVATFKITPAAGTPQATPSAAATADAGTPIGTPSSGGQNEPITIVAKNIEFDKDELTANAGPLTVILDNQDIGQPHNIHFFKGDSNKGDSVAKSDLKNGPEQDQLEFTVATGAYYYQCDAHPTMKGDLTVN